MAETLLQAQVGQLVAERPSRARVFEQFGLDYCCRGKVPLAEACQTKGVNAGEVIAALQAADSRRSTSMEPDWTQTSLSELISNIMEWHHAYLRRELPRLTEMTTKVNSVHGERHPELREVQDTFAGLRAELESHMMKEEQILFPAVKAMESGDQASAAFCGSVRNPIRVMEHEHDSAGAALARLRALTGDFTPPAEACNTYRAMLDSLEELEGDLHLHIHKENNILFPRATELEASLAGR